MVVDLVINHSLDNYKERYTVFYSLNPVKVSIQPDDNEALVAAIEDMLYDLGKWDINYLQEVYLDDLTFISNT